MTVSTLGQQFCKFYEDLSKTEDNQPNIPVFTQEILHNAEKNNNQSHLPLDPQFLALISFDDQKQEASAFLGREGGLEEFMSIVYSNEVIFLTEEAKTATALDLLSGALSEEEIKDWPSWRLQELEDFLSYRVRALERSRRLTQTGSFDPSLLRKSKLSNDHREGIKEGPLSKFLGRTKPQKQPYSAIPDIFTIQPRKPTWKLLQDNGVEAPTVPIFLLHYFYFLKIFFSLFWNLFSNYYRYIIKCCHPQILSI